MPSRPAVTLLLLSRQRVYRADFASISNPPEIADRERPDAPDLASVVETVLIDGPPVGKSTFVLATDFWFQTASLPASRAVGLSEADIARGLNFEAEVLSGLPALDAIAAISPLPPSGGERRFLLLQVPFSTRDGLDRVLADRGSRLAGLVHPAALPHSLGRVDLTLHRLELWPDVAVGMRLVGDAIDVQVSNADPATGRWQSDLAEWAGTDVLIGPGINAPSGIKAVELAAPQRMNAWFAAWAAELSARRPHAPVILTPAKPTSAPVRALIAGALALVAAAAVFFHWSYLYVGELADSKARTTAAKDKTKQLADLQVRVVEKGKERDKHAEETAKFERFTEQVKSHQMRYAQLLELLAAKKHADVMIQKIEAVGGEPKVIGTAMRPELADEFARELTPSIRALGWEVQSPSKNAMKILADGGPWTFEIAFHRIPDPKAAASGVKTP